MNVRCREEPCGPRGYHAERKGGKASVILVLILLVFISPLIKGAVGGSTRALL